MTVYEVQSVKAKVTSDAMSVTRCLLDKLLAKDFDILIKFLRLLLGEVSEHVSGCSDIVGFIHEKMNAMKG